MVFFYPDNEEKYFERRSERYYVTKRFFDNETKALIDLNVIYGAGKRITNNFMIFWKQEMYWETADMSLKDYIMLTIMLGKH